MSKMMNDSDSKQKENHLRNQAYFSKIAKGIIAETEGEYVAERIHLDDVKLAVSELTKVIGGGSSAASALMKDKARRCNMAIHNAEGFVKSIMGEVQGSGQDISGPIKIDQKKLEQALKLGKPLKKDSTLDFLSCRPPLHNLSFNKDNLVMRGDKICPAKDEAICDNNESWQTIGEHFGSVLPSHKLLGFAHKIESENGKARRVISGCMKRK